MTAWHQRAACIGLPTELWFPSKGAKAERATIRICESCPVRVECLESALREEGKDPHGIRGGLHAKTRYHLAGGGR